MSDNAWAALCFMVIGVAVVFLIGWWMWLESR